MRRKTTGFELGNLHDNIEISGTETVPGRIVSAPDGIGRAFESLHEGRGFIRFAGTAQDGPFYFRAAITVLSAPDNGDELLYVAEIGIQTRVGIVLDPDLTMYLHEGGPSFATVGSRSPKLVIGQRHVVEIGYTNNPALGTTKMEARLDGVLFASANLSATAGPCNMFGFGWLNFDSSIHLIYDDLAINDAMPDPFGSTDQTTWPGDGRVVAWRPASLDVLGNDGWTAGGIDEGSEVIQVASPLGSWDSEGGTWDDPIGRYDESDDDSWLVSSSNGDRIDFAVTNPYKLGLREDSVISVVSAQLRWRCASSGDTSMNVYLRAGSGLSKAQQGIGLNSSSFYTGNSGDNHIDDVISISRLPYSYKPWTVDELTGLRFGMETLDSNPAIHVSAIWGMIEYVPYEGPTQYSVLLDGEERAYDLQFQSLSIEDKVNEDVNRATFNMYDLHGIGMPENGDSIEIRVNNVLYFGGEVVKCVLNTIAGDENLYSVQCIDTTRILDRRLVAASFQNMTDKAIIEQIVSDYGANDGITTYHVTEGVMVAGISFNYVTLSAAFEQLAKLTTRNWYIDYEKDVHYFPLAQNRAPFDITPATGLTANLKISKDATSLRNRVFVRGGTELTTEPTTETQLADGVQRQFLLAEKPHALTISVNGTPKTVGIKNIDDSSSFDYMMNFEEKYVEAGTLTTTPAEGDVMAFSYNYDVPILVSVEDTDSIAEQAELTGGSGVYEFVIIDNQISSTQQARDRAAAELTDYAHDIIEGTYDTWTTGLRSGQFQRVTLPSKDVDDDYMINSVTLRSLGNGIFVYNVSLTSAKRMGIIKFLLSLLQVNRTVGAIDPNEKVDQLLTFGDTIDSLVDLVDDSIGGVAFKWSNDAGTTTNKLMWNLGQWK